MKCAVTIILNGDRKDDVVAKTIAGLVDELKLPAPAILIEHNGVALRRDEWAAAKIAEEDWIEMVRIVAGG